MFNQCDFSSFEQPGQFTIDVEGIGCSFPFTIGDDVYREPFRTVARGLYHNRSGIELKEPFTKFTRPAPHNPELTPGFAGKLIYTTVRFTDWGSEGGDSKALLAGSAYASREMRSAATRAGRTGRASARGRGRM